ncbi:TPA: hypothetical protein JG819_004713 [Vibrio parahaemolyticus]|nr:hypothetical protein [Vibrio parahaemolyticus]HAV1545613.1 hypothetical protein [Vibrio parahaemolyticus]
MARLTETGLVPVTLPEYKAQFELNYDNIKNATFDLTSNSPDGQLVVMLAQAYYELDQLQIQTDINRNPNRATGKALDDFLAHQGLKRIRNTKSVTTIPCEGTQTLTVGHQVKDNTTGLSWTLLSDIVLPSAGQFECEKTGPNYPTTDLAISTPETYWTGVGIASETNPGLDYESDSLARERRNETIAGPSQSMHESITGKVRRLDGVVDARTYINRTMETDEHGQPAKSLTVFVIGGADMDIAEAIDLAIDPMGRTVGDYSKIVYTDDNPFGHEVFFSRVTNVAISVVVSVKGLSKLDPAAAEEVKDNIVKYSKGSLDKIGGLEFNYAGYRIGRNIDASGLYTPVNATIGASISSLDEVSIPSITVARDGGPGATEVEINRGEVGFILIEDIRLIEA